MPSHLNIISRSMSAAIFVAFVVAASTFAIAFADDKSGKDEKQWKELGSREVSMTTNNDTFEVGEGGGKFNAMRIMVDKGDIDIFSVVVTFGNGERFEPKIKSSFKEGQRSQTIDFPGAARVIQKVDLQYKSTTQEGRGKIYLHGRVAKDA